MTTCVSLRSSAYSRILFELAGVEVLLEERQKEFPADLNPINMFALVKEGVGSERVK